MIAEYNEYQNIESDADEYRSEYLKSPEARDRVAPEAPNTTVITTQSATNSLFAANDGEIVAFSPQGTVLYYNETARDYWDADPVAREPGKVVYVATYPTQNGSANVIEVVNLYNGSINRIYSAPVEGGRWHDVDRINSTHYAVADIAKDRVFIVNVESDQITWQWDAEDYFPPSSGGDFDGDWTHLNDVEILDDDRIMVSIRNQDRVIFINKSTDIVPRMTLGEEDNYTILREQHNPDYIPRSSGGPSVLVADSDNDRVIEYNRNNNRWERTWVYSTGLNWPRDADRLPNGNTLLTNTRGDRVLVVNQSGAVVWSIEINRPYEAERIETGAESHNGPAAHQAKLKSVMPMSQASSNGDRSPRKILWQLIPDPIISALQFLLPPWVQFIELVAMAVGLSSIGVLVLIELQKRIRMPRQLLSVRDLFSS